jgi:hypothetical protein
MARAQHSAGWPGRARPVCQASSAMGFALRQFHPANFILGEAGRSAHAEIIALIQRKQSEGRR